MIAQTRAPVLASGQGSMIEVIAGALDGDTPERCARREAMEEGGVRLDRLEHVAKVWSTPATSTERVDYFLAEYRQADRVGPGGGLDEELARRALAKGGGGGTARREDADLGAGAPDTASGAI